MAVLVLDKRKQPLMPCSEKRARLLLARGRARVHRLVPMVIRLVDRQIESCALQSLRLSSTPVAKPPVWHWCAMLKSSTHKLAKCKPLPSC